MKKDSSNARAKVINTRKTIRKQKRLQKKVHRQEHYMIRKTFERTTEYTAGRFVKRPVESPETDINLKVKKKKNKPQPGPQDILSKERQKDINEEKKLQSQMNKQRKKTFLQANDEEDKIIKKLEKQLGLNKCKNKKNFFSDDGLDYLLEICDRATSEQIVAAEKQLANVEGESDFEDDLAVVTGKEVPKKKKGKDKEIARNSSNDDESDDDMNDDIEDDNGNEVSEDFDEDDSNSEFEDNLSEASLDEDGQMLKVEEHESDDEPEEQPKKIKRAKIVKTDKKQASQKRESNEDKKKSKEKIIKEVDLSKVFSDDEISHLSGDEDMEELSDGNVENYVNLKSQEKPDVWEDIYGRKRDKEGNIIKEEKGTYVPPHLRNKDSGSEKELAQLKRHIKSVLNKLAGTNLHWACNSIEGLYSSHSRNAVNTTLAQLWLCAAAGAAPTPHRLAAEHAALVAVLHANVAAEIGAHFLQELTKRFDEKMRTPQPMEDKTLDNLVACLAHLYSFKIYHASLLYDIFERLLEQFSEKSIDCVLGALRCVGGVLRREEPEALRTFIRGTQARAAAPAAGAADGSRIKFLLEVLMAVKNNDLRKIPAYEPTYGEFLRKQARGVVRKGNYITPLHIRLDDLLKAEERGKWWVVGSAWEGNHARQQEPNPALSQPPPAADQALLALAKQQRMNTDVRRSIFCVIMSAADYMDASEKLQQLGLRGPQRPELAHVVLACCLQERGFNRYYAVLAAQLCAGDRNHQLSIQYATWDKIKQLETLPKHSVTNLAQFLVHLILGKSLSLSVLKVIQFSDLNKHTVKFMRQVLLAIMLSADVEASLDAFRRVSKPVALRVFRESLRLFVRRYLMEHLGRGTLRPAHAAELERRTAEVDKILTLHESNLKF